MANTESSILRSYMTELAWANSMIDSLTALSTTCPLGMLMPSFQPDSNFLEFAERNLTFVVWVREGVTYQLGSSSAWSSNISTVRTYIGREKAEENVSVNRMILKLQNCKTNNLAVGLRWPDGQPDEYSKYFGVRKLPISPYLRTNFAVGDATAIDTNIATLKKYLLDVGYSIIK